MIQKFERKKERDRKNQKEIAELEIIDSKR